MKLIPHNLQYLNESGIQYVWDSIRKGVAQDFKNRNYSKKELRAAFPYLYEISQWSNNATITAMEDLLILALKELEQADDFFGTEGWEHAFGLD